jgi:DNA polymerase/3'-5' exonuclease PolX
MKLEQIKIIAEEVKSTLAPYCKRIEIAGSIRREKPECKDIEIVCIPDKSGVPLMNHLLRLVDSVDLMFKKNGQKYKKFLYDGIWVDLFITDDIHWGLTYLIRTGSKEFNIKMVERLKKFGYTMKDGELLAGKNKLKVYAPAEIDIFELVEMYFIEPKNRV